jgi:LPXTG-motif cell wall-anchored protein
MDKTRGLGAVLVLLVAGLGITVGLAPAAQAYPDVTFHAAVSDQRVFSGQSFTATSSANVECAWTHEWNGTSHRGVGQAFTSRFTAPDVQKRTVIPLHFSCTYVAAAGAGTVAASSATWTRTLDVTVLPARSREAVAAPVTTTGRTSNAAGLPANLDGSDLPDTGGPNVAFLVAGLVLLLSGAVAVRVARGRLDGDSEKPQA